MTPDPFLTGREAYASGENFGEALSRLNYTPEQKQKFAAGFQHEEQFQRRMRHAPVTTDLAGLPEEVRL